MGRMPSQKVQSSNPQGKGKPVQERQSRRATDRSIEEWETRLRKKAVPEIVILLAKVLTLSANAFWRVFELNHAREFINFSEQNIARWESFYRDPRLAGTVAYRSISRSLGSLRRACVTIRWIRRRWGRLDALGRFSLLCSGLFDFHRHLAVAHGVLRSLQAEMRKMPVEEHDDTLLPRVLEVQFIATVWLPSMLLLGKSPAELFQKADQGNRAALLELIRLDPFAKWLPAIVPHQMRITQGNNPDELKALEVAQAESIDMPKRRGHYKIGIAAMVIRFSRRWCEISGDQNAYINRTDMWNLFDLVGRETGTGNDSEDLPDFENYKRAVDRHTGELPTRGWDIFLW
jgi:hypothetical protein